MKTVQTTEQVHVDANPPTCTDRQTQTNTHTHIHVWGGFRGIGYLAAKLGTWIIPHFHGVYSYDVPRNIAISRPKMCKKKLHNRYDFLPVTGEKIELSNNARGHPIACILPLDCLTSDFWIWGYPHCFWIPHLPEMKSVCVPENPPIHTHTHTQAHTHTHKHKHTNTQTQTHTQTHTHTHSQFSSHLSYCSNVLGGGGEQLSVWERSGLMWPIILAHNYVLYLHQRDRIKWYTMKY